MGASKHDPAIKVNPIPFESKIAPERLPVASAMTMKRYRCGIRIAARRSRFASFQSQPSLLRLGFWRKQDEWDRSQGAVNGCQSWIAARNVSKSRRAPPQLFVAAYALQFEAITSDSFILPQNPFRLLILNAEFAPASVVGKCSFAYTSNTSAISGDALGAGRYLLAINSASFFSSRTV